jgi:O-antigen/teichoic acid export membrane protein
MFGFLNSAMSRATQRFLAFEIGRKDIFQLRNVFSMSLNIHFFIAFIVFLFAETIGLWFVNNQLTIPQERMEAARWVYHLSILSLMVNIVSVPYNAMIIAHERMNVFAWVSIVEVSLKLLIVFMLQWFGFDKLKFYAILMFGVSLLIRLIYGMYCDWKFKESKLRWFWDKAMFKTLLSFAGWNLWGNIASVMAGQGVNMLLNIFFGPVVNAARGIAFQVTGAINSFVQNFQMALNPQIIKSYAANDLKYMHQLIFQGAKFSFFLLLILSLPIILEAEIILKLWLKTVPDNTVIFIRLVLVNILIDSISGPLMTAAQATGRIKLYQGIVGGLSLIILPTSYFFLKLGYPPEITLYVSIFYSVLTLFARLIIIQKLIQLNVILFFINIFLKSIIVAILAALLPIYVKISIDESMIQLLSVILTSIASSITVIYLVGLNNKERIYLLKIIRNRIRPKIRK